MITFFGCVIFFLVFCVIVAWLVREEERKNLWSFDLTEFLERIEPQLRQLKNSFLLLSIPVNEAGEAFRQLGESLQTSFNSDDWLLNIIPKEDFL